MSEKFPKIIVIVGPTASGKSDLAVAIAREWGGEVVSADSRQVYRGLNIGTGKITRREMRGVPHHLLDIADPRRQYSVARYKKAALRAIRDILRRGKVPILCGGTGHYIDAVLGVVTVPDVPPNTTLRKTLAKKPGAELYETLVTLDPDRAATIDRHNPRRLVRAIEIATAIGKVPPLQPTAPHFDALKIGIMPPKETLRERIHARLLKRMRHGMVAEVRRLHEEGLSRKRMEDLGLEYRWLARFLRDNTSKQEMLDKLEADIRHYVKRQTTWWKRDKEIGWFPDNSLSSSMKRVIARFLEE